MTSTSVSRYLKASLVIWPLNEEPFDLKDVSRRLNRLRRKVYRETPAATGSPPKSTALALWQALTKKGFRAWCYEFGLARSVTHAVTIVETDGVLQIHDAFFNLTYPVGFHEVLDALRDGRPVAAKTEIRDRRIYVMDPTFERKDAICWLEKNADRELSPIDGLRRFELLWNVEAFDATFPGIEAAYLDLEERGYPRDLRFLMLHPIEMFDGKKPHRDPGAMPLLAGRDLGSPLAALRSTVKQMSRELASERERGAHKDAEISRLEGQRDAAQSSWAAVSTEAQRRGEQIVQLRAALDDEASRFAAERQKLSQALTEAEAQTITSRAEVAVLRAERRRRALNGTRSARDGNAPGRCCRPLPGCGSSRAREQFRRRGPRWPQLRASVNRSQRSAIESAPILRSDYMPGRARPGARSVPYSRGCSANQRRPPQRAAIERIAIRRSPSRKGACQ